MGVLLGAGLFFLAAVFAIYYFFHGNTRRLQKKEKQTLKNSQCLVVKVFRALQLPKMDTLGETDAFLKIQIIDHKNKIKYSQKTPVLDENLNPEFNVTDVIN